MELREYLKNPEDVKEVETLITNIEGTYDRGIDAIVDRGRYLTRVQEKIDHNFFGQFLAQYFESTLDLTTRTAYREISVAKLVDRIGFLPKGGRSLLYELAKPSTPDTAITEINDLEYSPTIEEAKEIIKGHISHDETMRAKAIRQFQDAYAGMPDEVKEIVDQYEVTDRGVMSILLKYFLNLPTHLEDILESGLLTWEGEKNEDKPPEHVAIVNAETARKIYQSCRVEKEIVDHDATRPEQFIRGISTVRKCYTDEEGYNVLEIVIPDSAFNKGQELTGLQIMLIVQALKGEPV